MNNIQIKLMSQKEAVEIADYWKYPKPYDFYDMTADLEDYKEIMDPVSRGNHYFSVLENQKLIGFFGIFPKESSENEIELGLGLKPELTGKGRGKNFVTMILQYIKEEHSYVKVWLSVADFNQRAITLYERVGFNYIGEKVQETNGGEHNFIVMNNFSK